MYIAIRIIPLVCLYIHECHMPITPYFFYGQKKDLAQRLTTALRILIGNIHIYVETRRDDAEYTDINWEDATFVT